MLSPAPSSWDSLEWVTTPPAPMREQLAIAGTLTGLALAYGVLGYVMYLFVREPKRRKVAAPG